MLVNSYVTYNKPSLQDSDIYITSAEHITDYLKYFLNNKNVITPEILLLNYDKLDIELNQHISLLMFTKNNNYIFNLNESIFNLFKE